METIQALMTRRSVREFDRTRMVSESEVQTILKAAMQAPSAKDKRPCHFIVVSERARLDALGDALPYAKMCKSATLAIMVCGDASRTDKEFISTDCSAAAMSILLTAHALGLGAVWTALFPRAELENIAQTQMGLPPSIVPFCLIPIGLPAKTQAGMVKSKFDEQRIHPQRW